MATVTQLADGRWIVQYRENGKKTKTRKYFGRGPDAEAAAREFADGLPLPGRKPPKKKRTFTIEEIAQRYVSAKVSVNTDSTTDRFFYRLKILLPQFGDLPANRVTPGRLDYYVNKRLRQGVKRTTVHRELSDLKAMINWAVGRDYISQNPMARYEMPSRDDEIILPVTPDEVRRILAHAAPHVRRAMLLAYYLGVRPGAVELLPIKWTAVDWDQELIYVQSARKGGPVQRVVPTHPALLDQLYCWFEEDLVGPGIYPQHEIIRYKGRPVKKISKAFGRAKERAGLTRRIPLYAFRHAFATMSLNAGGDSKHISELMGHSREDTTRRVYQHTSLGPKRAAIAMLPDLVFKAPDNE